jgi:serine/threonine protein kinase
MTNMAFQLLSKKNMAFQFIINKNILLIIFIKQAVRDGEEIAVKLLHVTKGFDDKQFKNELSNHMKVQHPNIVRLVGYCNVETRKFVEQDGENIYANHIYKVLCFEYMQGRSLEERLSGKDMALHFTLV